MFARKTGLDPAPILAEAGLTPPMLGQSDLRLPFATFARAFVRTAARLEDPALGVHAAEAVDFRLLGAFAQPTEFIALQLMVSSATVGEALRASGRVVQIAYGTPGCTFEMDGGDGVVVHRPRDGEPAVVTEHVIAVLVCALRQVATRSFSPTEVAFPHAAPPDAREHARVLGPGLRFASPHAGLRVAKADMELPLATADALVHEALEERVTRVLRDLAASDFVASVREVVHRELPNGNPLAENVSAQLGISTRTLARYLSAEGTTHQAILDSVRMGLTARYLREGRPVTEVARLVGFSALSAFHRAFRRWYGCAPAEWTPE